MEDGLDSKHHAHLDTVSTGTSGMPPDLQRFVNTIKALDEKAAGV